MVAHNCSFHFFIQIEEALPSENISNKGLDEKVDYALHKIEYLYKIIELLKSKVYYIPKLKENMLLLFVLLHPDCYYCKMYF
jgi:hypothetical protein